MVAWTLKTWLNCLLAPPSPLLTHVPLNSLEHLAHKRRIGCSGKLGSFLRFYLVLVDSTMAASLCHVMKTPVGSQHSYRCLASAECQPSVSDSGDSYIVRRLLSGSSVWFTEDLLALWHLCWICVDRHCVIVIFPSCGVLQCPNSRAGSPCHRVQTFWQTVHGHMRSSGIVVVGSVISPREAFSVFN